MLFRKITNVSKINWDDWFNISHSKNTKEKYGHTLMLGQTGCDLDALEEALKPYFEQAHKDARDLFHSEIGINLDPLTNGGRPLVSYPNSLPDKQKKGFFGEVLCGMLSQAFGTICEKQWTIPAYLFRHHDTASQYLHRLYYGEPVASEVIGRTGNDFLAICTNSEGILSGVLVGESKYRKNFSATVSKEVHTSLSKEKVIPVNLSKLKNLIKEIYPGQYTQTISSIEEIVMENKEQALERTDLFLFIFENPKSNNFPPSRINSEKKHPNHSVDRALQVFEIQLSSSGTIIRNLYSSLYKNKKSKGK